MEETTTGMEIAEQTSDAFLDGWDDVPGEEADQPTGTKARKRMSQAKSL